MHIAALLSPISFLVSPTHFMGWWVYGLPWPLHHPLEAYLYFAACHVSSCIQFTTWFSCCVSFHRMCLYLVHDHASAPIALTVLSRRIRYQTAAGAREGCLPRHVWRLWTWAIFSFHVLTWVSIVRYASLWSASVLIVSPMNSPVLYAHGHVCIFYTCVIHGID